MEGLTFAAIGAQLGVTWQAAQQAVRRSLEATMGDITEKAAELRAIEAERLDKITEILWPRVEEGDLRAIDRVLRARESYRRLTGIDMERASEVALSWNIVTALPKAVVDAEVIEGEIVGLPEHTGGVG